MSKPRDQTLFDELELILEECQRLLREQADRKKPTEGSCLLRVLSINIEDGAQAYDINALIDLIRQSEANVVSILEPITEEKVDMTETIAKRLGWEYHSPMCNPSTECSIGHPRSIISDFPLTIVETDIGCARLEICPNKYVFVIPAHFDDYPYQPYQALGKSYAHWQKGDHELIGMNPKRLIEAAVQARGSDALAVCKLGKQMAKQGPVIIAGDFNEPSHLDWTKRAVDAGLAPLPVAFPTSKLFYKYGFQDAFRVVHPDEVSMPGYTWPTDTAKKTEKDYRAERIDFVYSFSLKVIGCQTVESPSDHLGVLATFFF